MAIVTIYSGEPIWIPFQCNDNPLTEYDKGYGDIEQIYMGLKRKWVDADNSIVAKYRYSSEEPIQETGDILVDSENHIFKMLLSEDDLIPPHDNYLVALGIKVSGFEKMIWVRPDDSVANGVKVIPDGIIQDS